MSKLKQIKTLIKKNQGIITTSQIVEAGIERWFLTDMIRHNSLERVARGIYWDTSYGNYDERYFFQLQNSACIYSYQTALYSHMLTERIPYKDEVTVPQGYNPWRIKNQVSVHRIKKEWYPIGIVKEKTEMGNIVMVYDKERTMCDILRDRKNQDPEIFSKSFRLYLTDDKKDLWKLREYAKIFGITRQLEDILEIIGE